MNKQKSKNKRRDSQENWVDEVIERQEQDLEVEEEILSSVPIRMKHKYLEKDE